MGLRCLIGHDYGEPQTERDRRQRGSEVVVTVREFRECARCGHRRILSENKEVTADASADPASTETGASAAGASEASAEAAWSPPDDSTSGGAAGAAYEGPASEPMSAEEDDGVILEDEPERPARAHGEWPESEVAGEADEPEDDHGPWPDEDEASESASGAEVIEAASDAADPLDAGPEPAGDPSDPDETAEPTRSPAPDAGAAAEPSGGTSEPAAQARSTPTPEPDPSEVELVCPDCGETWASVNASLRPGDICPECRRGYLDEQLLQ